MIRNHHGLILAALLVLVPGSPGISQTPSSAQQKLLARRAAEVDAYRKIAERIKGLRITSQTTVRDFVTESDRVHAEFQTFIKGIRIVGAPVYHADGSCEVTVAVTLRQVIEELQTIVKRHYVGNRWHDHTFQKVRTFTQDKVITATGYGAQRPQPTPEQPAPPVEPKPNPAFPPRPIHEYRPAPTTGIAIWNNVRGDGRLLALRAARADAYRKLLERIRGVRLTSQTTVQDFVTESDRIHAALQTFVKGLRPVGFPRYMEDGTVELDVAVTLSQVIEEVQKLIKRHYVGNRYRDIVIPKVTTFTKTKVLTATGSGTFPEKTLLSGKAFPDWKTVNPRVKLMAQRGALVDGYRQLAERIKGLSLTSNTTVADFVTQSDLIQITSSAFLRGMAQKGNTVWYDDGTVAVHVRVTLQQLIEEIRRRVTVHGNPGHEHVLTHTRLYQTSKEIVAVGEAAASPDLYSQASTPSATPPPWSERRLTVTGSGAAPTNASDPAQAKLLAERAAEVDAKRLLAEQIGGLSLTSQTTVQDFILKNDQIKTQVQAYIQGAKIVATRHLPDGTAEVDLTLEAGGIVRILGGIPSNR